MLFNWGKPMQIDWTESNGPVISQHHIDNSVIRKLLRNEFYSPLQSREVVQAVPWWDPRNPSENGTGFRTYVPGLKQRPLYPQVSALTREQHFQGLRVLSKEFDVQPRKYNSPTKKDIKLFKEIKEMYEKEQVEYLKWAKQCWTKGDCIRVLRTKPLLEQVYDAHFKMKVNEMSSLPHNYIMGAQIPLDTRTDPFEITLKEDLHSVDIQKLPLVEYPEDMEEDFTILKSCPLPEPCVQHACRFILPYENTVSVLPMTEIHRELANYAIDNDASFIASENALQCVVETGRTWKLPVSVVEVICPDGDVKNVVVLGSEFSPQKECATQRTFKAYKHLLKHRFTRTADHDDCNNHSKKPSTSSMELLRTEEKEDLLASSDEEEQLQIEVIEHNVTENADQISSPNYFDNKSEEILSRSSVISNDSSEEDISENTSEIIEEAIPRQKTKHTIEDNQTELITLDNSVKQNSANSCKTISSSSYMEPNSDIDELTIDDACVDENNRSLRKTDIVTENIQNVVPKPTIAVSNNQNILAIDKRPCVLAACKSRKTSIIEKMLTKPIENKNIESKPSSSLITSPSKPCSIAIEPLNIKSLTKQSKLDNKCTVFLGFENKETQKSPTKPCSIAIKQSTNILTTKEIKSTIKESDFDEINEKRILRKRKHSEKDTSKHNVAILTPGLTTTNNTLSANKKQNVPIVESKSIKPVKRTIIKDLFGDISDEEDSIPIQNLKTATKTKNITNTEAQTEKAGNRKVILDHELELYEINFDNNLPKPCHNKHDTIVINSKRKLSITDTEREREVQSNSPLPKKQITDKTQPRKVTVKTTSKDNCFKNSTSKQRKSDNSELSIRNDSEIINLRRSRRFSIKVSESGSDVTTSQIKIKEEPKDNAPNNKMKVSDDRNILVNDDDQLKNNDNGIILRRSSRNVALPSDSDPTTSKNNGSSSNGEDENAKTDAEQHIKGRFLRSNSNNAYASKLNTVLEPAIIKQEIDKAYENNLKPFKEIKFSRITRNRSKQLDKIANRTESPKRLEQSNQLNLPVKVEIEVDQVEIELCEETENNSFKPASVTSSNDRNKYAQSNIKDEIEEFNVFHFRTNNELETSSDFDDFNKTDSDTSELNVNIFHFTAEDDSDDSNEENMRLLYSEESSQASTNYANLVEIADIQAKLGFYGANSQSDPKIAAGMYTELEDSVDTVTADGNNKDKVLDPSTLSAEAINDIIGVNSSIITNDEVNNIIRVNTCSCKGTMYEVPPPRSYSKWEVKNVSSQHSFGLIVHSSHKTRHGETEVFLEPIVEYQPELGATKQSAGRLRALALSFMLRKSAALINVRVDHDTGNIIVINKMNEERFVKRHGDMRAELADRLHTTIEHLRYLKAGHYVLVHDACHGDNAMIYSTLSGASEHTISLRPENVNMPDAEDAVLAKIPPDLGPELLPYHKVRGILPLAFPSNKRYVNINHVATLAKAKLPPQAIQWPKKKRKKKKKTPQNRNT